MVGGLFLLSSLKGSSTRERRLRDGARSVLLRQSVDEAGITFYVELCPLPSSVGLGCFGSLRVSKPSLACDADGPMEHTWGIVGRSPSDGEGYRLHIRLR